MVRPAQVAIAPLCCAFLTAARAEGQVWREGQMKSAVYDGSTFKERATAVASYDTARPAGSAVRQQQSSSIDGSSMQYCCSA